MFFCRNSTHQQLINYVSIIVLLLIPVTQSYATELLADITSRLLKAPISQGNFQQKKHLKILSRPLMSSGLFTYDQSKGVIWKTLAPVPSLLLVNESQLISGQGEQKVKAIGKLTMHGVTNTIEVPGTLEFIEFQNEFRIENLYNSFLLY